MFHNCKNSKKQGDFGLGATIAHFCKLGWTVCLPLTDSQEYDLIVDNGTGLKRVQVKTTSHKKEGKNFEVNLRTMGGNQKGGWSKNFDNTKVDILVVLTSENGLYVIPTNEINAKTSIVLFSTWDKFKI
jgi:hypothetical protein